VNSGIDDELFSLEEARSLIDLMKSWNEVINILDFTLLESKKLPEDIQKLALDRYDAKLAKNWAEADRIRDELVSLGWKMIDEKDGWRMEKI
jgi:cysteinyl-tRNA synthetase